MHPLANVFPMMTDDELRELADDIAEQGQLHPIIIDADGVHRAVAECVGSGTQLSCGTKAEKSTRH